MSGTPRTSGWFQLCWCQPSGRSVVKGVLSLKKNKHYMHFIWARGSVFQNWWDPCPITYIGLISDESFSLGSKYMMLNHSISGNCNSNEVTQKCLPLNMKIDSTCTECEGIANRHEGHPSHMTKPRFIPDGLKVSWVMIRVDWWKVLGCQMQWHLHWWLYPFFDLFAALNLDSNWLSLVAHCFTCFSSWCVFNSDKDSGLTKFAAKWQVITDEIAGCSWNWCCT